jgi:copper chaperone CopZ
VSAALKSVAGVKTVEVSYPKKQALVLTDKTGCGEAVHKAMSAALKKAGYAGEVVKVDKGS